MHVSVVMVQSVDGNITNGTDANIYSWTSAEDSAFFFSQIEQNTLIIMGSRTYEMAKTKIQLKPDKLRVVLTRNPEKFADQVVAGSLEFSNETPQELLTQLEKRGFTKALVVGGSEVNGIFFSANLVNELIVTIEPILFGQGLHLTSKLSQKVPLKLRSITQLNSQGTLLFRYTVT